MKREDGQPERESEDPASDRMTLQEVADYLKLHYTTVYRLAGSGKLPEFRLGGRWRCQRSDLQAWMARQYEEAAEIRLSRGPELDVAKPKPKPTPRAATSANTDGLLPLLSPRPHLPVAS